MAIDLITGYQGQNHITADQIADINSILMNNYGDGVIMRMEGGTLSTSSLTLTIATGYWRANGFDMEIQEAETIDFDSPTSGYTRIDNVYMELLQDASTGVQRVELVTVQGEEAESSPSAPSAPTSPELTTDTMLQCVLVCNALVSTTSVVLTDNTIDFVSVGEEVPWYCTSSTAASTTAKVATTNQSGFSLVTGAKVIVKFTYTNTASAPTLNVNSTGAKTIYGYGSTRPSLWWLAGDVVEFTYDGTNWLMQPTQGQITTLNSSLTYKASDTLDWSFNPLYIPGLFQDSTHIRLTLPFSKPINSQSVSIELTTLQVFSNGSYEEITSGLTISTYIIDGVGLYVIITNSSAFSTFSTLGLVMCRMLGTVTFS